METCFTEEVTEVQGVRGRTGPSRPAACFSCIKAEGRGCQKQVLPEVSTVEVRGIYYQGPGTIPRNLLLPSRLGYLQPAFPITYPSCNSSCPSGFHGNNCSIPCQCPEGLCHPVSGACQLGKWKEDEGTFGPFHSLPESHLPGRMGSLQRWDPREP